MYIECLLEINKFSCDWNSKGSSIMVLKINILWLLDLCGLKSACFSLSPVSIDYFSFYCKLTFLVLIVQFLVNSYNLKGHLSLVVRRWRYFSILLVQIHLAITSGDGCYHQRPSRFHQKFHLCQKSLIFSSFDGYFNFR